MNFYIESQFLDDSWDIYIIMKKERKEPIDSDLLLYSVTKDCTAKVMRLNVRVLRDES